MALNEIKEKIGVVKSVGGFANALQQIASMRMITLRDQVLASKRFVDEAALIIKELNLYRELEYQRQYQEANKFAFKKVTLPKKAIFNQAVIVVTSNQGLCGKFNAEIFKQLEDHIFEQNKDADFYLIGKKGQEHYLTNKKYNFKFYPYSLPDNFVSDDLLRLVQMFPFYQRVLMVYSRFLNTIKRDVVETLLVASPQDNAENEAKLPESPQEQAKLEEEKMRFMFEPSVEELIKDVSSQLRAATFQRQILDSRLAQFSSQMVGMQTASENAKTLLEDLGHEYNKQRRKAIDKKISEVLAGKALW